MKVYISGPITGTTDAELRFFTAKKLLLNEGQEAINPAPLNQVLPESATWQDYMDICIPLLHKADAIFMLRGWKDSKGAKEELRIAIENEKTVFFEREEDEKG